MGVEYDGSAYNGWQKQNIGLGIQTVVEKALSIVANHQINSICAGRTEQKRNIVHEGPLILL